MNALALMLHAIQRFDQRLSCSRRYLVEVRTYIILVRSLVYIGSSVGIVQNY